MKLMQAAIQLIFALFLAALISACDPVKPDNKPKIDPDIARASLLFQQGDYLSAAKLYRGIAARSKGIASYPYLLKATDASLLGKDIDSASQLLNKAISTGAIAQHGFWIELLKAEIALAQKEANSAVKILLSLSPSSRDPLDLRKRYLQDIAKGYRQLGNLMESANALQSLDDLPQNHPEKLANQTAILQTLSAVNELMLTRLQGTASAKTSGWMQLALLIKQHGSKPTRLTPLLKAWRAKNINHPALAELLSSYQEKLREQIQEVAHIAVLLPQSGPYVKAAEAIRDGIMLSLLDSENTERPVLRFYDSSNSNGIWPLYSEAVTAGAELVIGPLQKKSVTQLLRAGELPVPVLALNQVNSDIAVPINFFMFGLAPEDEARLAAERIWLDGHRHPMVLTPTNSWGNRIVAAFNLRWNSLTGANASAISYDAKSADYSGSITQLLHIKQSKARNTELQRWFGKNLEFTPRRRADADSVFMAAKPRQAQSLPPQLQFHHAGDLPIYTTSQAWNGKLSRQQLADMRGITLSEIPLVASKGDRVALAKDLPSVNGGLVRLIALGMDALNLSSQLKRLQSSPYEALDGQTGNLFMDSENRVLRQMVWLKLAKEPKVLGYAARLDLQSSEIETKANSTETPINTQIQSIISPNKT